MADYQQQLDKYRRINEAKAKRDADAEARKMSPEQIENWRRALNGIIGPIALFVPEELVYEFRDVVEQEIAKLGEREEQR